MTAKEWLKQFQRTLSSLPREERKKASDYYAEIFQDKAESGIPEEETVRELGDPASAAQAILNESGAKAASSGKAGFGRTCLVLLLFVCVGIPALLTLASLAIAGAAVFLSGFVLILAGLVAVAYTIVQAILGGFSVIFWANLGIGLAIAGIGCLLVPPFLGLTKFLFRLCGTIFTKTGQWIRGKREVH